MKGDGWKWVYSFVMLIATVGWACFTMTVVRSAIAEPSVIGILEASGTNILLGALIGWNTTIVYHWFRKRPTKEEEKS